MMEVFLTLLVAAVVASCVGLAEEYKYRKSRKQ